MDYIWSEEQIRNVLIELEARDLPFKKYTLLDKQKEIHVIGEGGFAYVFDSYSRKEDEEAKYAVKVIGFKKKLTNALSFDNSIDAQRKLLTDNVVEIKATASLKVWLDDNNNIIKVNKKGMFDDGEIEANRDCLELQFVLMEKLIPVLEDRKLGINGVFPKKLALQDRDEILRFAYDIGSALDEAHRVNVLHRDIKLENVFYDPNHEKYKLGDFGIATITEDGAADTIAYTKGYGAPEVVTAMEDKYDNTADIYSYGIMLYLIMNNLKFPGSGSIYSNKDIQYASGFVLPSPETHFPELFEIIKRMCSYNPDDRFQSMHDVLNELEGLMINDTLAWKRDDDVPMQVLGSAGLIIGAFFYKLTSSYELEFKLSGVEYIFLLLVLFRSFQKEVFAKKVTDWNLIIYAVGIASIVNSGFAWWKLVIIVFVFFSDRYYAAICAAMAIASNLAWVFIQTKIISQYHSFTLTWIPILCFSMGACILLQYMVLQSRELRLLNQYFGKKSNYWRLIAGAYLIIAFGGWILQVETDICKAGLFGAAISAVFWLREVIGKKKRLES